MRARLADEKSVRPSCSCIHPVSAVIQDISLIDTLIKKYFPIRPAGQ
jgi:hypothetical protein